MFHGNGWSTMTSAMLASACEAAFHRPDRYLRNCEQYEASTLGRTSKLQCAVDRAPARARLPFQARTGSLFFTTIWPRQLRSCSA
jgi:hypothetical protein